MISRSLKHRALRAVRSSTVLTCALFVADGLLAGVTRSGINQDEHLSGANLEADFNYSKKIAEQYTGKAALSGRVAELGPGGNAAVALHLLRRGADSVDLVDRFSFDHDPAKLDALYKCFDNYEDLAKIRFCVGEDASAERFFLGREGYDAIFSCAVLEHLTDPLSAIRAMASSLAPGGRMVHQIDLRDHGIFSGAGKHPLTFLTIPGWVYRLMSEARGRPNRVMLDAYRRVLAESGLEYRILATHLVEVGELPVPIEAEAIDGEDFAIARRSVDRIRPRLTHQFRQVSSDDLAISAIRIEATRPALVPNQDAGAK